MSIITHIARFSAEILHASDELNQVFEKYKIVIVEGKLVENNLSLLDLDGIDLKANADLTEAACENKEIDVLCDVFSSAGVLEESSAACDFLLPLVASKKEASLTQLENKTVQQNGTKCKALEELDVLSEHLLKENLQSSKILGQQFNKHV